MNNTSDAPTSSDVLEKVKALTKEKEVVDDKLAEKVEKLHHKAGELVDTVKEKKAVDDKLAKTNAERFDLKNQELAKTSKLMVGRELTMIEQKKEIAELKKSP